MCPSDGKDVQTEIPTSTEKTKIEESQISCPKRKIDQLDDKDDNNDTQEELSSEKIKIIKLEPQLNPGESVEAEETQAPVEKTVIVNSKPDLEASEPPKFKFGQTLNDPKYSWLNTIGKSPLGSVNNSSLKKTNGATSSFQGFKASSEASCDSDKATLQVNFDDLLTKGKDLPKAQEKPSTTLVNFKDDTITTGEEEEISCFEATGKLHVLGEGGKWKDRGVGQLKINCLQSDSTNRRIIMRLESVHKVILNVKVVANLKPKTEGKFVRFSAFESEGSPSSFTFRTSSVETANNMVREMLKAN